MKRTILILLTVFGLASKSFTQPTVTCDSVFQLGVCAGSQIIVPFTVSSTFNFGNVFKAELSDEFGSWANPSQIGQITWFTSGIIFASFPLNAPFGILYRVRIISTSPVDTSNQSPNMLYVLQSAFLNSITAFPNDTVCWGDTVTLGILMPGSSYAWSTGDTTQFITITQPGLYNCTTTDILNCTSQDTINIEYEICGSGIHEFLHEKYLQVFPNPSDNRIFVNWNPPGRSEAKVSIFDLTGSRLKQLTLQAGVTQTILLSDLAAGVYLLECSSTEGNAVRKIVVQR